MNWLGKLLPQAPPINDEEAMRRVQRDGDHAAFTRLLRRWEAPIQRLCTRMTDDQRAEFLRSTKVRYLVFSQKRASDDSPESADDANSLLPVFRGKQPPPGYLRLRYSNDDADVYEVVW